MKSRVKAVTGYLAVAGWLLLVVLAWQIPDPPTWFYSAMLPTLVLPLVGVTLLFVAFAMISWQGGWKDPLRQGPEKKWTLPGRLLVVGAGLGALWGIIVFLLCSIAIGLAWLK